jgi:phage anti-repressor protein
MNSGTTGRKNREEQIIMIQKNVRGAQARKLYSQMKQDAKNPNNR